MSIAFSFDQVWGQGQPDVSASHTSTTAKMRPGSIHSLSGRDQRVAHLGICLPVMILPMPVCGITGLASLFSNICQANAEALCNCHLPDGESGTTGYLQQC